MADLDALINQILNRRATVEQWMFDAASGKRAMPTADELRQWALKLGTPDEPKPAPDSAALTLEALQSCEIGGYVDIDGDWCERRWFDKAKVDAAIKALLASHPGVPPVEAQSKPDTRKPWEKSSWTCARATVTEKGMHCPPSGERCPDCPASVVPCEGTSSEAWSDGSPMPDMRQDVVDELTRNAGVVTGVDGETFSRKTPMDGNNQEDRNGTPT